MTDICDKASELEALYLEAALYKQQDKSTATVSNYYCDNCGEPIPEARRHAVIGCTRCVVCQEYFEKGFPG